MRQYVLTFTTNTITSIATSQGGTASTALTLNPVYVDPNFGTTRILADNKQSQRAVALQSTANLSTVLFTITGLDRFDVAQSFTITGPNANTVYSTTGSLASIYSIVPSATFIAASGVTAGWAMSGSTDWFVPSNEVHNQNVGVQVCASGIISYTLKQTMDNVFTMTSNCRTFSSQTTSMVGATTSQFSNQTIPAGGLRVEVVMPTTTAVGSLDVTFLQDWH